MSPGIRHLLIGIFLLVGISVDAQQYLVLQKRGKVKNFKYQIGNDISLQLKREDYVMSGEITKITDTSLFINTTFEIQYNEISMVLKPRRFIQKLSKNIIWGGFIFTGIVGFNGMINNDSPLIDKGSLIFSGSMVAAGFLLKPLYFRKFDMASKWQFKNLDFNHIPEADGYE